MMSRRPRKRAISLSSNEQEGHGNDQPNLRRPTEANANGSPRFRVAVDFGTTYTSVAFSEHDDTNRIYTIDGHLFDRSVDRNGTQVPTQLWYLNKPAPTASVTLMGNHSGIDMTEDKPKILYGYQVLNLLEQPKCDPVRELAEDVMRVTKPKLLLQHKPGKEKPFTDGLRKQVTRVLRTLTKYGFIDEDKDVIEHFLIWLLAHAKESLKRDCRLADRDKIEVTFCVPVCWSIEATAVMASCLKRAIEATQFGADKIPRLFSVNEAEAAAMHALTSSKAEFEAGDTFIMIDCGGGTTDIGTYTITNEKPLRLQDQVSPPIGKVCGSEQLNEAMKALAISHLSNETYLENPISGIDIENVVVAEIMPTFEIHYKRTYYSGMADQTFPFRVRGLRKSSTNHRIGIDGYFITMEDMKKIFAEPLDTIASMMIEQIRHAWKNRVKIDKVVVVGGFADSPALRKHLSATLDQLLMGNGGNHLQLCFPERNTSASGVARGAVMRAQNKEQGPSRVPDLSLGVLRHIPYDPNVYSPEVLRQQIDFAEKSKREYIQDTIMWVIKAGEGKISAVHTYEIVSEYEFGLQEEVWVAEEVLFTSETCTEDYFKKTHKKNRGKFNEFGRIEFDITHLKSKVKPHFPRNSDETAGYRVALRLVFKITGRSLEFTAYYPAQGIVAEEIRGSHEGFELSSMFKPGAA